MTKPPTMAQAAERGLIVEKGIATFSNGSHYEGWADANCWECAYYEFDGTAGQYCAFEGAALLGMVSPPLAVLFGWTENEKYAGSFDEPDQCAFFKQRPSRGDNDDTFIPPPPDPDPRQLVLIADPTEVIHGITPAPSPVEVCA